MVDHTRNGDHGHVLAGPFDVALAKGNAFIAIGHLATEAAIGGYEAAEEAEPRLEAVYTSVARLLNCQPDEIAPSFVFLASADAGYFGDAGWLGGNGVLMALNAADRHNKSFIEHLLPTAVEKKMGIVGMKIPARGRMFREGGITGMEPAMRYVLTLPVSTVIVGIDDLGQLEENVRIAREFKPMTGEEMKSTEELTKPYHADASWFKASW